MTRKPLGSSEVWGKFSYQFREETDLEINICSEISSVMIQIAHMACWALFPFIGSFSHCHHAVRQGYCGLHFAEDEIRQTPDPLRLTASREKIAKGAVGCARMRACA